MHFDGPGFVWLRHRRMSKASLKSRSNENYSVTKEQNTDPLSVSKLRRIRRVLRRVVATRTNATYV